MDRIPNLESVDVNKDKLNNRNLTNCLAWKQDTRRVGRPHLGWETVFPNQIKS